MRTRRPDAGFSLAALIFFAAAASIFIAAAVPSYQMQAKRAQEEELIFRGQEYARAIQKFQRRYGVYPPSIDQLLSTNGLRFLRKQYVDPITGKEFRLLTINPDGSVTGSKTFMQNMQNQNQSLFGNTQPFGQQQQGGQGQTQPFGQGQPGAQQNQQRGFASAGQQQQPQQQFQQQQQQFQQQLQQSSQLQTQRLPGGQSPQQGQPQQPQTFSASPQQGQLRGQQPNPFGGFNQGSGAPVIASAGIIGVASNSSLESIKTYNNRKKYDEWEFIAILAQQGQSGQQQNQQQPNQQPNQPGGGQRQNNPFQNVPTNPFGGQPTGSPLNPGGGFVNPGGGQRQMQNQNPFGFGGNPQPNLPTQQPGR
jgi:hypothetical protein